MKNRDLPIERNAEFELIDTWESEALGLVKVFLNRQRNQYVLCKPFRLETKFQMQKHEIDMLEQRLRELPEEVTIASSSYIRYDPNERLFEPGDPNNTIYLDYSSQNLKKEVLRRKQSGSRITDQEAVGVFGFLLGLGSFMEQGLEFHRSVCLKNLLAIENQLQLTNPYVSDSHIALVLNVALL